MIYYSSQEGPENVLFGLFTVNIPKLNNQLPGSNCDIFLRGREKRGLFWQANSGMSQWGPLSGSILQKVPSYNPLSACETSALLPRSLLIGQYACWHPPWHPVWVDCPIGAC